ncbi:YceI family protein [Hymenobacter terrestris]|uniref:YceI family protein n=1 Tax=Hymenobacter terrestris TaxID=2748310 RepID=A0ABX2Q0E4_9BACT|nr:YceI family protein [Hymenobacter terrestris]NVO83876.1 YceI family protein [Hymenobacter terrestris]
MKFLVLSIFLASATPQNGSASSLQPPVQAPAATTYRIGPAAVAWTGYAEVGSYAPSGTVQLRRGRFSYDGRTLRNGRFEFDMTTLAQEQAQLAEHLRGEDFFAVAKYPTAVFELREVRAGMAVGQLTLRGVTKPVRFPLVVEPRPDGRLHISGSATLDRTQFGIHYNSSSFFQNLGSYAIRNDFRLAFDLTAVGE